MKNKLLIAIGVILLLLLYSAITIYPDWLWFKSLGFWSVFWTMLVSKFGFGLAVWLVLIVMLAANLFVAQRLKPEGVKTGIFGEVDGFLPQLGMSSRTLTTIFMGFILIVSFLIATRASEEWNMVLRWLHQEPFGQTDPIYGKDIGFYIFSLPFYLFIRDGLQILIVFAGIVTICWYLKEGALQIEGDFAQMQGAQPSLPKITISPKALKHLMFLGALIVLMLSWGHLLKIYQLLYSTQGPAFGASYTDVHVRVPIYKVLIFVSLGFAVVLFLKVFDVAPLKAKVLWIIAAVWVGSVMLLANGLPVLVQKFIVKPNELAKELPYIAHSIKYTREAYALNRIKEVEFQMRDSLTAEDLEKNEITVQNIRIWDERPLLQTYRQIQAIRLYYDFNNVDVDRYMIDNRYRQIMLSARELVVKNLPPQAYTWVNRHLVYTHGYGVVASTVNEVTPEGLPQLVIKDLPPVSEGTLKIDRPEIYYGEKTDEYVLVKTKTQEFDYPMGEDNVYTTYEGKGGVPITSFMRRLLFAVEFLDPQILFTTTLTPESRIMYNRRIDTRAAAIAPFLEYDTDPYLVISDGRLFWMVDAYTASDMHPYSRRSFGRFKNNTRVNYVRNSVKVVIDAYNGDVSFYLVDATDPIVKTYARIFPNLFKPFEAMPAGLKKHVRYPRDFFQIQADTYRTYHMENARVFYNQEDLWETPDELYGDQRRTMEPYYVIIKLPEGEREEFLLMLPFTPSKKDNMIGWLAARCDLPNYGSLLVYKLPKDKLVYGPMQIEARVDQQTEISRELSLWGQHGSRVIRGNLLAIPVSETFVYVEPIYLQAAQVEQERRPAQQPQTGVRGTSPRRSPGDVSGPQRVEAAALPELKRVIVAIGNRLVMDEDLDKALSRVLELQTVLRKTAPPSMPETEAVLAPTLIQKALEHYHRAKASSQQGDWAKYGRELDGLEKILKELSAMVEEKQ